MKLTADQVEVVKRAVESSGIEIETLKDDVLDHLCCVIESELKEAREFDELLGKAIKQFAPQGLKQIESETVYLLNANKILAMKRIMFSVGFIGAFALTMGTTFKWLHWPGGDELFMIGFLTLTLLYAPLVAIDSYKVPISRALSHKLRITIGLLSVLSIGVGALLKVSGLFGGDFLLFGGSVVFAIGFLPFHFFTLYKRSVA
jgi:hypothetical protein